PDLLLMRTNFEWSLSYGAGTVTVLAFTVAEPAPPAAPENILPVTAAPVLIVILVTARMFPWNMDVTPSVAEVPTCQKTLPALAPPARITCELVAVVSVDPIWKMKTALGLPCASSVTLLPGPAPDIKTDVELVYRPGANVRPPKFPGRVCEFTERPTASL